MLHQNGEFPSAPTARQVRLAEEPGCQDIKTARVRTDVSLCSCVTLRNVNSVPAQFTVTLRRAGAGLWAAGD